MTTPERYERVHSLFAATCELPPAERAAVLERECADDPSLRSDVEALLAKDADGSSFMKSPFLGDDFNLESVRREPEVNLVGQQLSHYRITRVIAAGGMGTVYEAEQDNPKRSVAIKVLRRGVASRSALRRFEYEAQVLARLRHSGIAQVYEAGSFGDGPGDGGVPYFVMEYVPDARPITRHTWAERLSTRQRLELFADVCDAVHHGHQKGVIHRDLKPSNILVDSSGQAKIIDFGVARATDSDMAVTTMRTDVGQIIGTLQYMSPEQCQADPHALDTRSDVYSLGVVLYELVCEQLPYNVSNGGGLPEAVRVIREQPPRKPSTIRRTLRGDVETITLKALEKDPARRYPSASALADDLRRHLSGQPILACPPSAMYQFKKLITRHKAPSAFVAALLVMIVGFGIWMAALYQQAGSERDRAREAEGLAEQRLAEAEEARDQAGEEKAIAEAVYEFMHHTLTAVEPGRETTVRELLDEASAAIGEEFPDQPLIEAEVRNMIQAMYGALGQHDLAEPHAREMVAIRQRELGDEHPETLRAMTELAWVLKNERRYTEAESLFRQVLDTRRRLLGEDHPDTIKSLEALVLLLNTDLRLDEAEPLAREMLEVCRRVHGEEHWQTQSAINALALILTNQGKLSEAEPLYRQGLETLRRAYGDDFPQTMIALYNLGRHLEDMDKPAEAEPLFREGLERSASVRGAAHINTIRFMQALADTLRRQGRSDEGEKLYRAMLETARTNLGGENPNTVWVMEGLAVYLQRMKGRLPDAEPLLREVLAIRRRTLGDEDSATIQAAHNLGYQLWKQGELAEAQQLYEEVIERRSRLKGKDHPTTLYAQDHYAELLADLNRPDEAEVVYRQVIEGRHNALGDEHPDTLTSIAHLARLYHKQGRLEEAEPLFRQVLEIDRRNFGEEHSDTIGSMVNLASTLRDMGRFEEAEPLYRQALEIAARVLPADDQSVPRYRSAFGACLAKLARFKEAEEQLLAAYEGLKGARRVDYQRTRDVTIARLSELYEAWDAAEPDQGYDAKSAEWRPSLDTVPPTEPQPPE